MPHQNPFNGRCIHGNPGVRYEKGVQVCKCKTTKSEPRPGTSLLRDRGK